MIKIKLIKTAKAEMLVIGGLPKDVDKVEVPRDGMVYFYQGIMLNSINILPGKWQPLGFLKDIKEDVAKELVDKSSNEYYDGYKDYKDGISALHSATESLHSLVEANCKLENSLGQKPTTGDFDSFDLVEGGSILHPDEQEEYTKALFDWRAEEETVFINPYLLKKMIDITQQMYCLDGDFFFEDVYELIEHLDLESEEDLKSFYPNGIEAKICELKPIHQFNAEEIVFVVDEDRWPEDDQNTYDQLLNAIKESVDFEKLNSKVPKLWYPTNKVELFTSDELIEAFNEE